MVGTNAASLPENAVGGSVRNLAIRCAKENSSGVAPFLLFGMAPSPNAAWDFRKSVWSLVKLPTTGVGHAVCASASVSKATDVNGLAADTS